MGHLILTLKKTYNNATLWWPNFLNLDCNSADFAITNTDMWWSEVLNIVHKIALKCRINIHLADEGFF